MNIYILGGGCFGTQYARWLLTAREREKIDFENLIIVDRDSKCVASKLSLRPLLSLRPRASEASRGGSNPSIEISDWTDFLVDYIENAEADTRNLIVPSHAAPHLLGKAFVALISSLRPRASEASREGSSLLMIDIPAPIGTPFEKSLEKGVIAVSMATWNCPANCPEPGKCPHIHAPRDWDLEVSLRNWAEKVKLDEFYVFPARHFAYAVSAIPAQTVIEAWRSMQNRLQKKGEYMIGIATSSACHGIVSIFKTAVS